MSMPRRERDLIRLVFLLREEIRHPTVHPDELDRRLREQGMGWAIGPGEFLDDDDWLTPDQIAYELGYSPQTIRTWAHRYGLQSVRGTYRWGDISHLFVQRHARRQRLQ